MGTIYIYGTYNAKATPGSPATTKFSSPSELAMKHGSISRQLRLLRGSWLQFTK